MAIGTPTLIWTPAPTGNTGATAYNFTTNVAVAAGSSIIVAVLAYNVTGTITIVDSAANTYVQDLSYADPSATAVGRIFSVHNCIALPSGSTIQVNCTGVAPSYITAIAVSVTGLARTSTRDVTASGSSTTTTASTAASATTSQADELIFVAATNYESSAGPFTWTPGSGYTTIGTAYGSNAGNFYGLFTEHRIVSTTGSYTGTATAPVVNVGMGLVSYKSAAVVKSGTLAIVTSDATVVLSPTKLKSATLPITTTGTVLAFGTPTKTVGPSLNIVTPQTVITLAPVAQRVGVLNIITAGTVQSFGTPTILHLYQRTLSIVSAASVLTATATTSASPVSPIASIRETPSLITRARITKRE